MSNTQLLQAPQHSGGSSQSALEEFLHGKKVDEERMLPAIIVSYDRVKNIATIKPLIVAIDTTQKTQSRHQLALIPVLSIGGGGFHVNFPIKEGDLGWILASDRDISIYKQTLKESKPNTNRLHKFADGLFIPDVMRQYTINADDKDAMVIQSTDGACRISIRKDNIHIVAPTKVLVTTPLTEFSENVKIGGGLEVVGTSKVTGASTLGKTSVEGIDVKGHKHTDPQGGDVGPMK